MNFKKYLITGGAGFIGAALVHRLVREGHQVRVLDNNSRGSMLRLASIKRQIEFIEGDIRDFETCLQAVTGVDAVCHLAFINGTKHFYSHPDLVLDVGVKGITNIIDSCLQQQVGNLFVASSSEVYQIPPVIPTDESAPLSIPDPLNPRYSYAGGKIIAELMALNHGRKNFDRVVVFRPHNVYGEDMGWDHVIPEFITSMDRSISENLSKPIQKILMLAKIVNVIIPCKMDND